MKHLISLILALIALGMDSGCAATRISKAYVVITERYPMISTEFVQSLIAKATGEQGFTTDERFASERNLTLRKVVAHNGGRFEIWLGIVRNSDEVRIWISYDPQLARSLEISQLMQFVANELEKWGAVGVPIETSSTPFV
ncbi:MAG: hypothetical protein K9M98_16035 [Cephaloticoccus sp.]|nr:hypothetical protein [Cephaloticoccus sp.]MCF7762012.1 hypothetical protein [Cephaloticoccus sp.]